MDILLNILEWQQAQLQGFAFLLVLLAAQSEGHCAQAS